MSARTSRSGAAARSAFLLLAAAAVAVPVLLVRGGGPERASSGTAAVPVSSQEEARRVLAGLVPNERPRLLLAVPAQAAGTVAPSPDERSGTEGAVLRFLRGLAREDPAALAPAARRLLEGEGTDAGRVAALRAVYEAGDPRAEELFLLALTALPAVSDDRHASVPEFAVRFLGERARGEERARALLAAAVVGPRAADVPLGPRRRAALWLARRGTDADLETLGALFADGPDGIGGVDPLLAEGVLAALGERGDSEVARRLLFEQRQAQGRAAPAAVRPTHEE